MIWIQSEIRYHCEVQSDRLKANMEAAGIDMNAMPKNKEQDILESTHLNASMETKITGLYAIYWMTKEDRIERENI